MGYFDISWDTYLTVDASPIGLGATLWQSKRDDESKVVIVSTASKFLTDVEPRYSQFENEEYEAVWGCENYLIYLFGFKF